MYRTDFWTLWEKVRVGCFKRTSLNKFKIIVKYKFFLQKYKYKIQNVKYKFFLQKYKYKIQNVKYILQPQQN